MKNHPSSSPIPGHNRQILGLLLLALTFLFAACQPDAQGQSQHSSTPKLAPKAKSQPDTIYYASEIDYQSMEGDSQKVNVSLLLGTSEKISRSPQNSFMEEVDAGKLTLKAIFPEKDSNKVTINDINLAISSNNCDVAPFKLKMLDASSEGSNAKLKIPIKITDPNSECDAGFVQISGYIVVVGEVFPDKEKEIATVKFATPKLSYQGQDLTVLEGKK